MKTNTNLIGKQVNVMTGRTNKKILHKGEVVGETINGIQVGVTWTSLGLTPKPGCRFISIFYAHESKLVVTG